MVDLISIISSYKRYYQETERAGFLNQSDILREEDPLSLLPRALSEINETRPYKRPVKQAGSMLY